MDHPDLAHIACVAAAAGVVLLLAGRGRALVVGGLALVTLAGAGLIGSASGIGRLDAVTSPLGAGAGLLGLAALVAAAAVFVRRPAWVPVAVLLTATLRPPITLGDGGSFPIGLAEDGQLGRLLPLYFVLAAAGLALGWRALSEERRGTLPTRGLPTVLAIPLAGFTAYSCLSLLWAGELRESVESLVFFTLPFAVLVATVGRAPYPEWAPRVLGRVAVALAALFAAIGLYQAATKELFFFAPNLEISNANSSFFRVTSLFGDPSLYGRHLVLGMSVVLTVLALRRIDERLGLALLTLLWAGLFFSYSQSSMIALVVVTLLVAAVTGGRRTRVVVVGTCLLVALVGVGYLTAIVVRGDSLRRETADRSQRVEDTVRVIERKPLAGVGIGGQAEASRSLSDRDRPTPNFVSHTTPLTIMAELGAVGVALYLWLVVGIARMLAAVRRLEPALGLALLAAFLAILTHTLFYPGFLEDPLTWIVAGIGAGHLTWPRRDDGMGRRPTAASPAEAAA